MSNLGLTLVEEREKAEEIVMLLLEQCATSLGSLLVVMENAHWMDPLSWGLLHKAVVRFAQPEAPLVRWVVTYREFTVDESHPLTEMQKEEAHIVTVLEVRFWLLKKVLAISSLPSLSFPLASITIPNPLIRPLL